MFLCRALGEFHVGDGLAGVDRSGRDTQRREEDIDVRRSALEAIALLVSHCARTQTPTVPHGFDRVLRRHC